MQALTHLHFVVDQTDGMQRPPAELYRNMTSKRHKVRLPALAGQKLLMVSARVEVVDKKPCDILRVWYDFIVIGSDGSLDLDVITKKWGAVMLFAREDYWFTSKWQTFLNVSPPSGDPERAWRPSEEFEQRIREAALSQKQYESTTNRKTFAVRRPKPRVHRKGKEI